MKIILVFLVLLSIVSSQTCQPYQTYTTPKNHTLKHCKAYENNTCCDEGNAKRAYNWAYEDDGCGVVRDRCLQLNIDLACYINCAPNIQEYRIETYTGLALRPKISNEWLKDVYNSCISYAWCGTSQLDTSTCTFLEKETRVGYKSVYEETVVVNQWDTCTAVASLTVEEFSTSIMNVGVDDSISADRPLHQVSIASKIETNFMFLISMFTIKMIFLT